MKLITRSAWNARPPKNRTPLNKSAQKGTALHYSAANTDEQAEHANCFARVRAIQNFHMDVRGWADIAYSYLCCKHGYTFEGRGLGIRTAGQGTNSGNDAYHAVCFLGDDTAQRDDVTDAGRRALKDTIAMCNGWTTHADTVRPHSWFHPTGCPGDELRAWLSKGMPLPTEEELTGDDRKWIVSELDKIGRRVARWVDHGDDKEHGTGNHHERIRTEMAALRSEVNTRLTAIEQKLPAS